MDGLRADVYLGLLDSSYAGLDDAAIVEELRALHPEPANGPGPQGPDHDDRDDGSSEPEDAGPDNDPDDGPNDGPDAGPDAGGPAADPADQAHGVGGIGQAASRIARSSPAVAWLCWRYQARSAVTVSAPESRAVSTRASAHARSAPGGIDARPSGRS